MDQQDDLNTLGQESFSDRFHVDDPRPPEPPRRSAQDVRPKATTTLWKGLVERRKSLLGVAPALIAFQAIEDLARRSLRAGERIVGVFGDRGLRTVRLAVPAGLPPSKYTSVLKVARFLLPVTNSKGKALDRQLLSAFIEEINREHGGVTLSSATGICRGPDRLEIDCHIQFEVWTTTPEKIGRLLRVWGERFGQRTITLCVTDAICHDIPASRSS